MVEQQTDSSDMKFSVSFQANSDVHNENVVLFVNCVGSLWRAD